MNRHFGPHRGTVVDADDPLARGRLLVAVPSVGLRSSWALPCVPYAGAGREIAVPPAGAPVWVEFEEGDLDRPVWVGVPGPRSGEHW